MSESRRMRIISWREACTGKPCYYLVMEWFMEDKVVRDSCYQMSEEEFDALRKSMNEAVLMFEADNAARKLREMKTP